MMDENKSVVPSTAELDSKIIGIANELLTSDDVDKSKDQLDLFNWYLSKKNISRLIKLNDLYDSVTDQMVVRFNTKSDQFTNSDLLDYVKTLQTSIATSEKNLDTIQQPPTIVQQTNTQVNINVVDTFDRDAKARILAAVQATLSQAKDKSTTEMKLEDKDDTSKLIEVEVNTQDDTE